MESTRDSRPHPRTPVRPGLVADYLAFLRESRKWWLLPILVVTLMLGMLVFLAGTGAAPFIYTLF